MANIVEIAIRGVDNASRVFEQISRSANRAFGEIESQARDIDDVEIDVDVDTRDARQGFEDLEDDSRDTADKVEKDADKMGGAFKKLAKIIAGAFAVDKIKDFAVSGIEAAASAQALEAQFEQVFGDIGSQAQKTVNELGKNFGMLPNRIKPAMTSMTSMFKGLGLDTETAMKTAEQAVTLVADAAAFYDKSFEDANAALNSFIKGNYEGGESIGLFANETQLATWAAQNLGLEWKNLDEAGKQVARLEYAKAMQEAAGATGQAARESDSYENQLGNLKQAWTDMKATLMAPLLEPVIQGFKLLAEWIQKIDIKAIQNAFATVGGYLMDVFGPVLEDIKQAIGLVFQAFEDTGAAEVAKDVLEGFKTVLAWIKDNTEVVTATLMGLAGAFVAFKVITTINKAIGIFTTLMTALKAGTLSATLAQWGFNTALLANPITWVVVAIGALIAAIVLLWKNWDTVSKWLSDSWEWIKAKAEVVFGLIAEYLSDVWNSISETISEVWGSITEFLTETWNSIVEFMRPIFQRMAEFLSTIWEGIKTVAMAMWNVIVVVLTEIWEGILGVVTPIFEKIAEFFSMVWEGIKEVTMAVWEFIVKGLTNLWNAIIDFAIPIFEGLAKFFTGIWEGIKRVTTAVWESIRDTTVAIWRGIVEFITPIWEVIKETASTIFNAIKDVIQAIWDGISEITSTIWETIKGVLSAVWEGIKTLAKGNFDSIKEIIDIIWNTIKTATETVWNGIKTVLTTIWENIKNVVDTSINAVKTVVESVWNVIKTITSAVWNGITNVVTGTVNGLKNAIGTAFNWIKNTITNVWNGVKNTTKSIWDSMVTIIKAPVNGIINIINGLIGALNKVQIKIPKVPDWIPGIGGKGGGTIGFNIPKIPMLARGGFIKGGNPTPAVIGEGRYDEAVIPLNDTVLGKLAEMIASRMGTSKAVEHRHFGTLRVVVENAQQGFEEIVDVVINEIRREVRA